MKPCWPDGDLRAYLDGELPLETQGRIGEHLEACSACSARYRELSERAARVANFMAMLPEAAAAGAVRRAPVRQRRQWAIAALALAAGLAIGFVMLPKSSRKPAPIAQTQAEAAASPVPAEQPAAIPAAAQHSVRRRSAQPSPAARADYFLLLDDEPLETGTLVRVGAEGGDVQADLILCPDGRTRAIRVISNQ